MHPPIRRGRRSGRGHPPSAVADRLADWGFLANPDLPDRPGPAELLVAIRPRPSFRHFDPEIVEYWATTA